MLKLPLMLAAGGLLSLATSHAQLVNRYNLTDATDSVGGANGTFQNTGGTATLSGNGQLLTQTAGGANATDYVALPSNVASAATGSFTIEDWATQTAATGNAYATLFSLSSSTSNFLLVNANRNGGGTSADFEQPGSTPTEINVVDTGVNAFKVNGAFGTEVQFTLTYIATSGVATMYINGTQIATGNVGIGFSLANATAGGANGIGGGDAYKDPTFSGSTDDFRIYANALTAAQITSLDAAGPNATNAQINAIDPVAAPEPSTWMAMLVGVGALLGVQRFRRSVA